MNIFRFTTFPVLNVVDSYRLKPYKKRPKLLDREFLKIALPEGVHLVEDYEDALTQIVYPEGAIDVTYEEMDKIKENVERYAAFTLESFKQDHKDRIRENKKAQ